MRKSELRQIIREEISKLNEDAVGGIIRYNVVLDMNKNSIKDAIKFAKTLAENFPKFKGMRVERDRADHPNGNTFHRMVGTVAIFSNDFFEEWYFVEQGREKDFPTR
jgi:hypothetical protein